MNAAQCIEAAYLSACSPQAAYEWLHSNRYVEGDLFHKNEELEFILFNRNDPFIDLGIARYGRSKYIEEVCKRGEIGVRCAAIGNKMGYSLRQSPYINGYIQGNQLQELESVATCPYLTNDCLEYILLRKADFQELSEEQYKYMLGWLGNNPRMSTEYQGPMDGWAESRYDSVFITAWKLAESLPATQEQAAALGKLLNNTIVPYRPYKDVHAVLERWRIEPPGTFESEEPPLKHIDSFLLRSRLADVLDADDKLLNSEDLAVRQSFYRRFPIYKYGNADIEAFIEKDGEIAFRCMARDNKDLWTTEKSREFLRELSWKVPDPGSHLDSQNFYSDLKDINKQKFPEWFADENNRS